MATYQQYFGRFTLDGDHDQFRLTVAGPVHFNLTLTRGDYFISGYAAEAVAQFCEHMQAVIRAADPMWAAATVIYTAATGLIRINFDGVLTDITWTDAGLQSMLGFSGVQTGGNNYVASFHPRYVWRPSRPLAEYPGDLTAWWGRESTTIVRRSPTGVTVSNPGPSLLYGGRYVYRQLTTHEAIESSGSNWRALETFWADVIDRGQAIRCYPDRTLNTVDDIRLAIARGNEEGSIGSFYDEIAKRRISRWNGRWDATLNLWRCIEP